MSNRDISERKLTEERLQKALDEIKQLRDQLQAENVYFREEIKLEHNFEKIIGQSAALKYTLFRVEQVAPLDTNVLILGDTGTGKELVARAVHEASPRKNRPLIKVNCANLPSHLIESELFGHEKGAFSGAEGRREGRFELADGATLFLDEMMLKLYEEWISPEQSLAKKEKAPVTLYSRYADQARAISFFFSGRPHKIQVLDFGMGWGTWCLMAKAFGYDVYGFEISKDRVAYARNNAIKVLGSMQALREHRFDFINADQVFEHLPNPRDTLEELAHTLKPEGILRIAVPNGEGLDRELKIPGWKASKNAIHPLEHINCFTVGTLKKLADSAGLSFLDIPAPSLSQKSFKGTKRDPGIDFPASGDHNSSSALDFYLGKQWHDIPIVRA